MLAIDNTSLAMFKDCPRKYQLGMIQGYRPKTVAAPLSFGKIYHDCLEYFDRQVVALGNREDALRATVRKAYELTDGQDLGTDSARTRATLLRSLVWYEAHWRNDMMETYILPSGKPAVELSFRIELPCEIYNIETEQHEPVVYCGHIDKIVTYNGTVMPLEHKHTKSSLYDSYWDRYVFSSQISGYYMACMASFNIEVGGAVIDATQVGVNFSRFGRRVANRVAAHQQEWILDTAYWMQQLNFSLQTGRFPHNSEACSKYGGCQFRSVCFSNPSVRQTILDTEFRIEKWDPLRNRGED